MEPLLQIADELERRDADVAEALRDVERLQSDVEELRTHGAATARFLAALPGALAARADDERQATEALAGAHALLREAEAELERRRKESDRLAAERHVQQARNRIEEAEQWLARSREEQRRLEEEGEERRREAARLEARAAELAVREPIARDVPPPAPGLDAALDWASRARGELLVEHGGLATERDKIVREASELVASALGEPLAATGVAGMRERLKRALPGGSEH